MLAAGKRQTARSRSAMAELCESYSYPLYAFLRREGHSVEESQDLVQGLFLRLLERRPLPTLRPERGRFRSYLLAALRHYAVNEWQREHAIKRGGGQVEIGLDVADGERRYTRELVEHVTAETLYERRWATVLLARVLERLRREYQAAGKAAIFSRLEGVLSGASGPPEYDRAARELGISEGAVKVAVHRLRRRYRDALRREIADTVSSHEEVEEELRFLREVLGR